MVLLLYIKYLMYDHNYENRSVQAMLEKKQSVPYM